MSDWRRLAGGLAGWATGAGQRLVFVHGFTQTSRSWKPVAESFAAAGYESVVVDAPGHGESSQVQVDLEEAAQRLTAMCGAAVYVGYSMGGRLCLHAASAHPDLVLGLATIGASPGIAADDERAARRAADDQLATRIEAIGVPAFLDEWLAQPMFAGLDPDADQRADRLRNSAAGLASSLRLAGAGAQQPLWHRLPALTMPVLAMAGENDTKYASIGSEIAAEVAHGRFVAISGAGHAAHLERPDEVVRVLVDWLDEISS